MEIKNVNVYGLKESKIRSGYPMTIGDVGDVDKIYKVYSEVEKDNNRATRLANVPVGSGHDNFMKGIIVQFDLKYPEYISPQLQRYSHIDIISSQSKMHKLTSIKKFTKDMFARTLTTNTLAELNFLLALYKNAKSNNAKLGYELDLYNDLPSGYLKWMGISTNYLQLKTIYQQRRKHKLPEWQYFCDWIETLPSSYLITGINK